MDRFYKLKTFHGTQIAREASTGIICSFPAELIGPERPSLVLYVPPTHPRRGFLMADRMQPLTFQPQAAAKGIVSLGVSRTENGTASIYDPNTGLWACAAPLSKDATPRGSIAFARNRIDSYERFSLAPMKPIFVPPTVLDAAAQLNAALQKPFDLELLLATTAETRPILEALAPFINEPELQALVDQILTSSAGPAHLGKLYPDDLLVQHGLLDLVRWQSASRSQPAAASVAMRRGWRSLLSAPSSSPPQHVAERPVHAQVLTTSSDSLWSLDTAGQYVSFGHEVTILARRAIRPRQKLCIIATARNEGLYILDWLAYHRTIGVEEIFQYTNDNDDGSDALLHALASAGALHWVRNEVGLGGYAQPKAYGHALMLRPEVLDYHWALVIDLDEYLVFNPSLFRSAAELVDWYSAIGADAVALNWIFNGSGGTRKWQDDFIVRRFQTASAGADRHVKTLFRPNLFSHSGPHVPLTHRNRNFDYRGENGLPHMPFTEPNGHALSANPSAEFAWINHYFFKSAEDFLWKWSRNRGDHATIQGASNTVLPASMVVSFMQDFENRLPQRVDPQDCAPGFDAALAALLALPGVSDAFEAIKAAYASRIKTIVPMFVDAPGILEAGEAGRAFLATLGLGTPVIS